MLIAIILGALLYLSIITFVIISMWKVFVKAGQPGWACIVPIYNILIMLKIANKPWWWIFMFIIPIANLVFAIMLLHRISLSFGKGGGFTVGLLFLGIIFWGILAFDKSEYKMIEEPA